MSEEPQTDLLNSIISPPSIPRSVYWIGGSLGGFVLAITSAAVMWLAEKKIPNGKTIGRDVLLGVILFFILLQILPESTMALVTTVMSIFTFSAMSSSITPNVIMPASDEMEVRVGVPKF